MSSQIVEHHANWLLAAIDNSDDAPVDLVPPGTVHVTGQTAVIYLTDGDATYSLTLQPTRKD